MKLLLELIENGRNSAKGIGRIFVMNDVARQAGVFARKSWVS